MSKCTGNILIGLMMSLSFLATPYAGHHETGGGGHDTTHDQSTDAACVDVDSCPMSHGIVISINKELQKITLKHGEIANIEMPPMTMVFNVSDPQMLDMLEIDDHVMFHVESINGAFMIKKMRKDMH
jgi:Cu(I)/Ag(I) efflux system periplasmic protein CusF